ncbi:MAG: hypothetical protein FJW31_08785 [Acidobacteria bacterium]|nr:hypothetical protein [Acidobacteriota bacterium]
MHELKPLSPEAVDGALAKAERYRLLNEPAEAESICLDVLEVDPGHQAALKILSLALSDQITREREAFQEALSAAARLDDEYDRLYFTGIAWERRAKARHEEGGHGASEVVSDWISRAMDSFARAEAVRPTGNDDALLRWNTCVRFLQRHPRYTEVEQDWGEPLMLE